MKLLFPAFLLAFAYLGPTAHADTPTASLQEYLKIDTTNPPGNESLGTRYLGRLLDEANIAYQTSESAPGRGNLWAKLEGGNQPGLVLLHHIDVVSADTNFWGLPPFSGALEDGYIHGRGAIDTKGLGIAQLQAFIALNESRQPLNRDVIYIATADEEAGGLYGAGWLLEHHPEIFDDVGYLINEGGSGTEIKETPVFRIEVTQKVPLWLRLTATDTPGHGSSPRLTSSVKRILRAGNEIANTPFKKRVVPEVAQYFTALATFEEGERRSLLLNIEASIRDEHKMHVLQSEQPWMAALLSNTCSPTVLQGSNKINVVPPVAILELDCRLLPDQDPNEFVSELRSIIIDDNIEITRIMGFTPASSEIDTPLFKAITKAVRLSYKNAATIPYVATGFTDSHFFRDIGIVSYGFAPFLFNTNEHTGVHGNDERISVENLNNGVKVLTDLLFEFALERSNQD
jgi:acetylornithine deacetylase/succinyl-diaminopimelate desuccinylase-like protein